jgi:predicted dehydrogenase
MANKLQWGLIGTGRIAREFAASLAESSSGELAAIGSRSEQKANEFAQDFPATTHGSYEALLADPAVEAVYISTPHPSHSEWTIKAAEAGKHILCEKPIGLNAREAAASLEAARRHDVFLMEAFMYRIHPQTARLVELIRAKAIGDVQFIRAAFGYNAPFDLQSRVYNHTLAGGGILDVGCYCTSMTRLLAGAASGKEFEEPTAVKAVGIIGAESRVDEFALASLEFPNEILAEISTGVRINLDNNVRIIGTHGSIVIPEPWQPSRRGGFSKIILFKEGIPEEILIESPQRLYTLEADHVARLITEGQRQSPAMSWEDTLGNMRTLDAWRASIGFSYDWE